MLNELIKKLPGVTLEANGIIKVTGRRIDALLLNGKDFFDEDRELLLENMRGVGNRAAHFTSAIACIFPNGDTLEAEGICPGSIAYAPQGDGGFGYDPIFFLPQLKKTYAQLTADEKAMVSHRGKALEVFDGKLREYLANNQ